jgi:hypothetical protein
MDLSENRIKMCDKANEIQALFEPRIGDTVFIKAPSEARYFTEEGRWPNRKWTYTIKKFPRDIIGFVTDTNGYDGGLTGFEHWKAIEFHVPYVKFWVATESVIWLPHQDQLQEMIGDFNTCLELLFRRKLQNIYFTSMEQVWMALVMNEKYNKVWGAEGWVS